MARLTPRVNDQDHIIGPANAPVTLVEYGDFECPYCGAAYPVVKEVRRQMGDQMRFVWRQFPLTEAHPHAEQAAESSEAAAAQGKFWPMHDLLFEHRDALDFDSLVSYARQLGLDVNRFRNDLETHRFADRVQEQFMSGVRSGVAGTPTFFINGEKYEGAPDVQDMIAALQQTVDAE